MANAKSKYIEDCALLIDQRVRGLQDELDGPIGQAQSREMQAHDRAAISEARHLARLVRALAGEPYRGHPLEVANGRLGFGPKVK